MINSLIGVFRNYAVLRFAVVGFLNTAFSFGVYSGFVLLGLHYALASIISILSGVFFSYFTNGRVVFKNFGRSSIVRYLFMWAVIYSFYVGMVSIAVFFGVDAVLGGFFAMFFTVPLSFLIQKNYVFRRGVV